MRQPMRRNIRLHVALLFAVAGLGLSLYGGYRLQTLPVYSEKDLELATELNLSLDLARIPPDRQPPAEELPKLREGVRAEVEADTSRDRKLAKSWLQTGAAAALDRSFAGPHRPMTIMTPKPVPQSHWNLDEVVAGLREQRARWREARHRSLDSGGREFPARDVMQTIMDQLCGALFPMRLGPAELRAESEDYYVGHTLDTALNALYNQV
eukprot:gene2976-3842_t